MTTGLCECGCGGQTTIYKGKPRRFIHGHVLRAIHDNPEARQRLLDGHAHWRQTPEGLATVARMNAAKTARLRSPEHRAAVSRAGLGRELQRHTATTKPTPRDLEWAAGFLEGEGSFFLGKDGYGQVSATQVNLQPLHRIAALFGGKVYQRKSRGPNCKPCGWWRVTGSRCRGVAMTLYQLLSDRRREQVRTMLAGAR